MAREGQGYPCCQHDMMMMMMTEHKIEEHNLREEALDDLSIDSTDISAA